MKRIGGLFEQVVSFQALVEATRRAARAGGARLTNEAASFCADLELHCLELRRTLLCGEYRPGDYHTFMLLKPKPRLISAAPFIDRVVHHSLCAALEPHLERHAIFDSYACRQGRGLHRAIARAERFSRRFKVYLKLDIHHYFETIHHDTIKTLLRGRFKDERLLKLCELIIDRGAPRLTKGQRFTYREPHEPTPRQLLPESP